MQDAHAFHGGVDAGLLFGRVKAEAVRTESDVFRDGMAEELIVGVLENHADFGAYRGEISFFNAKAVHGYCAGTDWYETGDAFQKR